jgi:hypothetical protein
MFAVMDLTLCSQEVNKAFKFTMYDININIPGSKYMKRRKRRINCKILCVKDLRKY